MGEHASSAINANNLVLVMAIIASLGIIGGWIGKKIKIPDVVIFLILGILFGPTFLNLVNIDPFPLVNELILTFGSAFILYEGGREVKLKILNKVKISVGLLSSVGVIISAIVVAVAAHYILGLGVGGSLLLGVIVASTDPAALIPVFKTVPIKKKIKQTVISESAFNDAFGAVLFTSVLAGITLGKKAGFFDTSFEIVYMIAVGVLVGVIVALLAAVLISEKKWGIFHHYAPIISTIIVVFSFEISERLGGSGYMAVFISGLVLGNSKLFGLRVSDEDHIAGIHFRENISTIARMSIFIVLGSHVDVGALIKYGLPSILVVLVLMFIARPLVVLVCTAFDKKAAWKKNDKIFMMWVRETGVIPAALSGIVVANKVPGYEIISAAVFTTILITLVVQASTTKMVAKKLGVLEEDKNKDDKVIA